jgi:DNA polymerase-3 subunit delta'
MPFSDFCGNRDVVDGLREMLARKRLPHAVILSGAAGSGKYRLATMLARAMNCVEPPATDGLPDFCGRCTHCVRLGQLEDLDALAAEAVEARETLSEADRKQTRIFVQTHPDVLVIPPDPPQMMIKVDQVRRVKELVYFRPSEGRERVFVFTDSAFVKEAANSLLKVLEEPPEFATIFLLARTPAELLATIRSRAMAVRLKPLSIAESEAYLAECRPELKAEERALVARLADGAIGRAREFDLASYAEGRSHALTMLRTALRAQDHSELFKITEGYRGGAEGRPKIELLVRSLYSLLEDLLFLLEGSPELVRNIDVQGELQKLSQEADFEWLWLAARELGRVERGLRFNLLRSLSLDAWEATLKRGA